MTKARVIHLGDTTTKHGHEALNLPVDEFVESTTAVISKRGRGKSGVVKVVAEEVLDHGLPIVLVDPTGVHWGLLSTFDGKKPSGYPVLVIGGAHGHVKLNRRKGRELAQAVAKANFSCIIDLKGEPKSAWREFMTDFADELLNINDSPRLVILEEAPEFLPQKIRPDQTQCFDALERLVRLGRNQGLGVVLVGQRPARINKDVLSQADTLICLGVTGKHDRKAIQEWVEDVEDADTVEGEKRLKTFIQGLAALEPREAWVWSPQLFKVFGRTRIHDFHTFHADKTHLRRLGLLATKPVATDVSGVLDKLSKAFSSIRDAELEKADAATLRGEVSRLRRELEVAKAAPGKEVEVVKEVVQEVVREVPAFSDKEWAELRRCMTELHVVENDVGKKLNLALEAAERIHKGIERVHPLHTAPTPRVPLRAITAGGKSIRQALAPPAQERRVAVPAGGRDSPMQRILDALAELEALGVAQPSRVHAAFLAGYTNLKSQGFTDGIREGKEAGFIELGANDGTLRLTADGRAAAKQPSRPRSPEEMQQRVIDLLGGSTARVLKPLLAIYPESMTREDLGAEAGYTNVKSQGFTDALSKLKDLGFTEYPQYGHVKASSSLFLEA